MANTTFSGPVISKNGFVSGTSAAPISVTSASKVSSRYASTSASTGDTRLSYDKLTFTSTGSGETLRAFSVVTGAGAAAGGTINGAHISTSIDGSGTISGAANALRATLGFGAATVAGGTLASIQVDSDIARDATVPATASFLRFTNSGAATLDNLMNVPVAMVAAESAAAVTHVLKIVASNGTPYYIMVSDAA